MQHNEVLKGPSRAVKHYMMGVRVGHNLATTEHVKHKFKKKGKTGHNLKYNSDNITALLQQIV